MAFAHITLATRDVEATATFFEATLGWKRIPSASNIKRDAAWFEMGPGQQIHILHADDFEVSPFDREFGRHFAIFYPGSHFDALKKCLTEHGAEIVAAIRPTPFERFFFRDPNGYMVEVIDEEKFVAER